jgi:hypothetical protein
MLPPKALPVSQDEPLAARARLTGKPKTTPAGSTTPSDEPKATPVTRVPARTGVRSGYMGNAERDPPGYSARSPSEERAVESSAAGTRAAQFPLEAGSRRWKAVD